MPPSEPRLKTPDPSLTPAQGIVRPGIAYVDDDEVARRSMRRRLYAYGVVLETYESGEQFLAREASKLIGVLLDYDLAGHENGHDLAQHIVLAYPQTEIAFLTANHEVIETLSSIGPVFQKDLDLAPAIEWLLRLCRKGGELGQLAG